MLLPLQGHGFAACQRWWCQTDRDARTPRFHECGHLLLYRALKWLECLNKLVVLAPRAPY